jgi:hypothetical protein
LAANILRQRKVSSVGVIDFMLTCSTATSTTLPSRPMRSAR